MQLQIATIYHTFLEIYYVVYRNSHKNMPTLTLLPENLPRMEEIRRGWALFHETIVNINTIHHTVSTSDTTEDA